MRQALCGCKAGISEPETNSNFSCSTVLLLTHVNHRRQEQQNTIALRCKRQYTVVCSRSFTTVRRSERGRELQMMGRSKEVFTHIIIILQDFLELLSRFFALQRHDTRGITSSHEEIQIFCAHADALKSVGVSRYCNIRLLKENKLVWFRQSAGG